jgi:heterodisulfide reductase subunit A
MIRGSLGRNRNVCLAVEDRRMNGKVMIVGGGVTGLGAALSLEGFGIETLLVEKGSVLGGRVRNYSKLFPDFRSGNAIAKDLISRVERSQHITRFTETEVVDVQENGIGYSVSLSNRTHHNVGAVVLTCGFETFDAMRQAEYGYGVYPNVINALDLESLLDINGPTEGKILRPSNGKPAHRIAIVFCVGSRNKKIGNSYCSRICCSYSTKQAIEIMERDPETSVTCFYMDIRTYGRGFEEMYHYAQELGVKYIRGRVSECAILPDGDIQIRAENTLLGRPVQGIFDLVSLSVGMMPCADAEKLAGLFRIGRSEDGFFTKKDEYLCPHDTSRPGIFLAGSITGLKPIKDCLMEAMSVGGRAAAYLNGSRG